MNEFVNDQYEASLEVPLPPTIKQQDIFLRSKKNMRGGEGIGKWRGEGWGGVEGGGGGLRQ